MRMRGVSVIALGWSSYTLAQHVENFTGSLQIVNGQGTYSGTLGGGGNGGSSGGGGSAAVPAQCPASFPVSCSNLQQPHSCCPSDNYCSWANSIVACCPTGKTCSGSAQTPTTTYYPPTTEYHHQNPTTDDQQPHTTVQENDGGQYCKTLVAVGPGLPATQAGECGTILIVEAEAVRAAVAGWCRVGGMLAVLHAAGGAVLMRR